MSDLSLHLVNGTMFAGAFARWLAIGAAALGGAAAALASTNPLDLRAVANMGLRDEVPGDRTGGWTDQGSGNDLAALKPGPLAVDAIAFDIADPAANQGKSVLMLRGPNRDYFPSEARVTVPPDTRFTRLYMFHATAWTPAGGETVGEVHVEFMDGGEERRPILLRRDVGDWWAPGSLANAKPVWQAEGVDGPVGLYATRLDFSGKPVRAVVFRSTGRAVWGIVAATASDQDIVFPSDPVVTFQPDANWVPLPAVSLDIAKDSVFDFSFLTEAPAGAHGFLQTTPDGHFAFEGRPGERVRFWGVNLTFGANFPTHQEADALAERLVRSGYNTVRLHHFDRGLLKKGGGSDEFDPAQLDRLDYLFAAFKRRGVYLNIDLFSVRATPAAEIPEFNGPVWFELKGLVPLFDSAFQAWGRFATALLRHKNPYTGLSWAEDPALIGICPINEDTLVQIVPLYNLDALYRHAFEGWLGLPENAGERALDRSTAYHRFLVQVQSQNDRRMREFLRGLGVRAALAGANWMTYQDTSHLRFAYDYADLHGYWDHPNYMQGRWGLPAKFAQNSATAKLASFPRFLMASRIIGKPTVVTEFTFCWPNQFRAEGPALAPAYSSLQDWDAVYHFNYSDVTCDRSYAATMFELASDPIRLLGDRFSALVFRTGAVEPAHTLVGFDLQASAFAGKKDYPWSYNLLGLGVRIGTRAPAARVPVSPWTSPSAMVSEEPSDAANGPSVPPDTPLIENLVEKGALAPGLIDRSAQRFRSETGQLELDARAGTFRLATVIAEAFVTPPGVRLGAEFASVANGAAFAGTYVLAIDRLPLRESRRLLLLHLTDLVNTGTVLRGFRREFLDARGELPYLVRHGVTVATLRPLESDGWQAWAVAPDGRRLRPVPVRSVHGQLEIELRTDGNTEGATLAYELVRLP